MASLDRTSVSIRIIGDDLDPDEITRLLGKPPSRGMRKGESRIGRSGRQIIARSGMWSLEAEDRHPGDLSGQIVSLLSVLNSDPEVWRTLNARYRCDLFCGLFMREGNEGEELTAEALRLMAERGLRLGLDIYGSLEDA